MAKMKIVVTMDPGVEELSTSKARAMLEIVAQRVGAGERRGSMPGAVPLTWDLHPTGDGIRSEVVGGMYVPGGRVPR